MRWIRGGSDVESGRQLRERERDTRERDKRERERERADVQSLLGPCTCLPAL